MSFCRGSNTLYILMMYYTSPSSKNYTPIFINLFLVRASCTGGHLGFKPVFEALSQSGIFWKIISCKNIYLRCICNRKTFFCTYNLVIVNKHLHLFHNVLNIAQSFTCLCKLTICKLSLFLQNVYHFVEEPILICMIYYNPW